MAGMVEKKNAYRASVWKRQRQRPLGKPGGGWEDNIKIVYIII